MKRIEDERIRFYLKHRQLIEEWANVGGKELSAFARQFYASLQEEIRTRVATDPDVEIIGDIPNVIRLRQQWWPQGAPTIELGWHQTVDFSDHHVWCGIHIEGGADSPYWQHLRHRSESTQDYPRTDSTWGYPMYRYLDPPDGNLWEDNGLEKHGSAVIEAVVRAWCDLGPLVDGAIHSK